MKIGVILGPFSVGSRPLDLNNLYTSPRGLTGTDLAFVRVSEEIAKAGHEVHSFSVFTGQKEGFRPIEEIKQIDNEQFDAVINFNEPNLFEFCKRPFKLCYMMLNDFTYLTPGSFDHNVDRYVGVCQQHADYVATITKLDRKKWSVIPLGCDPHLYNREKKVKGRMFWCSSADRGLQWLLSIYPEVKAAVPEASLNVAYHFSYEHIINQEQGHPHVNEMAQRVRYIREMMPRLKHLGVEHIGSVSRERMVQEWNEASVFPFTADTVAFSEGFSVSTLEAHGSYTLPIITDIDCFGGIYRESGCLMFDSPIKNTLSSYKDALIYQLSEIDNNRLEKCRKFAENHTWQATTNKLLEEIK
jgi:hypothetical protein